MSTPSHDGTRLETLAQRVLAGSGEVEELARRLHPEVFRWALLRTGNRADAEDISQEAVWKIVGQYESFTGASRFTTWAFRITMNAASDFYRRTGRHETGRTDAAVLDEIASSGTLDDERLDRERLMRLVRSFFELLPAGQRIVFSLVDLEGRAPRDVAEMLNMNPNTVRAHLLKARRFIRGRVLMRHAATVEDGNG